MPAGTAATAVVDMVEFVKTVAGARDVAVGELEEAVCSAKPSDVERIMKTEGRKLMMDRRNMMMNNVAENSKDARPRSRN
jgi:hypothetical protein